MSEKGFSEHAKGKATSPRPGGAALPAEPPARICREASFTKPTEGLADIFARQWTTAWAEMPGRARLPRCRPAGPLWSKRAGAVLLLGPSGSLGGGNPTTARRRRAVWIQRSDQISCSVVSDSLRPHELQHARPPCPSPTPGVHSDHVH